MAVKVKNRRFWGNLAGAVAVILVVGWFVIAVSDPNFLEFIRWSFNHPCPRYVWSNPGVSFGQFATFITRVRRFAVVVL